jgi:hypothetical protein
MQAEAKLKEAQAKLKKVWHVNGYFN